MKYHHWKINSTVNILPCIFLFLFLLAGYDELEKRAQLPLASSNLPHALQYFIFDGRKLYSKKRKSEEREKRTEKKQRQEQG